MEQLIKQHEQDKTTDELTLELLTTTKEWRGYFYDAISQRLAQLAAWYLCGEYIEEIPMVIYKFLKCVRRAEIFINVEEEFEHILELELCRINFQNAIVEFDINFPEDDGDYEEEE